MGQFFLLGAFLLIALFYVGMQFGKPLVHTDTKNLHYIIDNVKTELPHALNLGINKTTPTPIMTNFTRYLDESLYFVNFSTLWIYTDNIDFGSLIGGFTETLNVTLGNFLDYSVTVNVTVDGTSKDITIVNNETNSTAFEVDITADRYFNMTVKFDGTTRQMNNTVLDKYNLYALIKVQRGGDFIKEELVEPIDMGYSITS